MSAARRGTTSTGTVVDAAAGCRGVVWLRRRVRAARRAVPKASASWLALGCPLSSLVWNFEVVSTAKFDKRSSASFYDVHDHMGCTCTHREPPPRAQTPPNTFPTQLLTCRARADGASTFYDEVICVRTPQRARARGGGHSRRHCAWRRPTAAPHAPPPRRWGTRGAAGPSPGRDDAARARSRRLSRILDGAAPHAPAATTAKKTRAGPPAQVQDRAGHADVCVGIKVQAPHVVAVTASARWRGGSRRSTQHLNHGVMSTQAIQQGHRSEKTAPLLPRQET